MARICQNDHSLVSSDIQLSLLETEVNRQTEIQLFRNAAVQHFGPFINVITIPSNRTTIVMKSPALHTTLLDK